MSTICERDNISAREYRGRVSIDLHTGQDNCLQRHLLTFNPSATEGLNVWQDFRQQVSDVIAEVDGYIVERQAEQELTNIHANEDRERQELAEVERMRGGR